MIHIDVEQPKKNSINTIVYRMFSDWVGRKPNKEEKAFLRKEVKLGCSCGLAVEKCVTEFKIKREVNDE